MNTEFHKAAILSCKVVLRPIVQLLLSYGLSFREFSELAKHAYIEAANEEQNPPNISETAVRTGISRKAIKKLLELKSNNKPSMRADGLYDLRLLEIWREDVRYLDQEGNPVPLYFSGDSELTLLGLINQLGVDIPPSTILKRLLSADMINIDEDGRYYPQISNPTPSIVCPETLVRASLFIAAHVRTVVNNFNRDGQKKLLERQTFSVRVPSKFREEVLEKIRGSCNECLADIERIIATYEVEGSMGTDDILGIGMYTFDFELPVEDLSGVFNGIAG